MRRRDAVLSECARATTAAEYRFRIAASNSLPRAVTVVALDVTSEDLAVRLAARPWGHAVFRTAASAANGSLAAIGSGPCPWLRDLSGRQLDPIAEITRSHLVVMVVTAGADTTAATALGELCRRGGVPATTLVCGAAAVEALPQATAVGRLRAASTMLVTTPSTDFVADMLVALRA